MEPCGGYLLCCGACERLVCPEHRRLLRQRTNALPILSCALSLHRLHLLLSSRLDERHDRNGFLAPPSFQGTDERFHRCASRSLSPRSYPSAPSRRSRSVSSPRRAACSHRPSCRSATACTSTSSPSLSARRGRRSPISQRVV